MQQRQIITTLQQRLQYYPIVTITGPRQSGKTTLVKNFLPTFTYVNLEQPDIRALAETDPKLFFQTYAGKLIIDEIQRVPALLSWLQVIVDDQKENGCFILTGSQNFNLLENISQSLAGRVGILHLLPFSLSETLNYLSLISDNKIDYLLWHGFYPRLFDKNIPPQIAYSDYISTYIERDVRQIVNVKDLSLFTRFLQAVATRVGQIINKANIASDLGLSEKTIEHWLSVLETSWIIKRLQPWHANVNKRLTKSPKLYFYDVGLVCHLLNIKNIEQLNSHPLKGNIFENFVVVEYIKNKINIGEKPDFYFYKDSSNNEIDLLWMDGNKVNLVEIKMSSTFNESMLKNILFFQKLEKVEINSATLIYNGKSLGTNKNNIAITSAFEKLSLPF